MSKTKEVKVLQQNWGNGWDDIITYEKENGDYNHEEIKRDWNDYVTNEPNIPLRLITRRIAI